jgi:tetratricopeptide (TPR) repeat protein
MPNLHEAQRRHACHYEARLSSADRLYLQGGDGTKRALAQFDLEWPNIETGQKWAAAHAQQDQFAAELCSSYGLNGSQCLSLRLTAHELFEWAKAALAAVKKIGDCHAEGVHLGNLGAACAALGQHDRAAEVYQQALALARTASARNRRAEGNALAYLGAASMNAGQTSDAIEFFQQWLATTRDFDRRDEGTALMNLGVAHLHLRETARSLDYFDQALAIALETGNLRREGDVYVNIAVAYGTLGDYPRAVECLKRAAVISREIGDFAGEGGVLCNLGVAYVQLGDYTRAIDSAQAALAILEPIDDHLSRHARELLSQLRAQA